MVGGASYIGSQTCLAIAPSDLLPIVYDNLSNGHREFVKWEPLVEGDIRDRARIEEVPNDLTVRAVNGALLCCTYACCAQLGSLIAGA